MAHVKIMSLILWITVYEVRYNIHVWNNSRCGLCVWHCQPAGIYPQSPQTIESKQSWWVRADSCCSCLRSANATRSSHTHTQALECLFVVWDIKGSLSLIHSSWISGLSIAHRRRLHRHMLFCVYIYRRDRKRRAPPHKHSLRRQTLWPGRLPPINTDQFSSSSSPDCLCGVCASGYQLATVCVPALDRRIKVIHTYV